MNVILFNGSPKEKGCTYTALSEVSMQLNKNGIDTEIIHVAGDVLSGCKACGYCTKNNNKCMFSDDKVNETIEKVEAADGLIVGSPVYYASPNGSLISFLDRFFYAGTGRYAFKPAAAVVSARRAGTTATLDVINKYFHFAKMPIVSANYWNMVHGGSPEEVKQDLEGLQIMRTLADNMAWLLKSIEAGKNAGVIQPTAEQKIKTSFIR